MNNSNLEHGTAGRARTLGAVVATVCVMGLVGALWLHPDHPMAHAAGNTPFGSTATSAPTDTAFLPAPAAASAIPSADQVFASRRDASSDGPAAPTF